MGEDFKNLKVISDGTAFGTKVQTEDGVNLAGVQALKYEVSVKDGNEFGVLTLKVIDVKLELNGKVEVKEERV